MAALARRWLALALVVSSVCGMCSVGGAGLQALTVTLPRSGRSVYYVTNERGAAALHAYDASQQSPPLVILLHGSAYSADTYSGPPLDSLSELNGRGIPALTLDLPGKGKGRSGSVMLKKHDRELFLADFFDALGGQAAQGRLCIVAASMSGTYAFPFIQKHAQRVASFVPVAAVGGSEYLRAYGPEAKAVRTIALFGSQDRLMKKLRPEYEETFSHLETVVFPDAPHACYMADPALFNNVVARAVTLDGAARSEITSFVKSVV